MTAIDPAVDVPVSVFVLRVAIVYPTKCPLKVVLVVTFRLESVDE